MAKALFILITLLAMPAMANDNPALRGDLFANSYLAFGQRPWVPSDGLRGADMFPPQPLFMPATRDLFDRVPRRYEFGNDEMVHLRRPIPEPYQPMFLPPR